MAAPQPQAAAVSSAAGVSGPGSAGGPGSQQQPQPTQLVGSAQSGLLQQQQQDFDPVQRYKMLIPQLKESLQVMGRGEQKGLAGWLREGAPRRSLLKERSKTSSVRVCVFVSHQSEALGSCSGGTLLIPALGQQRGTHLLSSRPVWSTEFQAYRGLHNETLRKERR